MSLKAFHIFFIVLSVLLAFGFALWALGAYRSGGPASMVGVGIASALCGIGLILYGVRFLRKLRHVSYL